MVKRRTLPQIRMEDGIRSTFRLKSRAELIDTMLYHGFESGYSLAKAAGIKPGIVNFLVSGQRRSCSPASAAAIEAALSQKPGTLFVRVSHVPRDTER